MMNKQFWPTFADLVCIALLAIAAGIFLGI